MIILQIKLPINTIWTLDKIKNAIFYNVINTRYADKNMHVDGRSFAGGSTVCHSLATVVLCCVCGVRVSVPVVLTIPFLAFLHVNCAQLR